MPQKGQITRHEWEQYKGKRFLFECPHCLITKHDGFKPALYFVNGKWEQKEPPCITRKIQEDENTQV